MRVPSSVLRREALGKKGIGVKKRGRTRQGLFFKKRKKSLKKKNAGGKGREKKAMAFSNRKPLQDEFSAGAGRVGKGGKKIGKKGLICPQKTFLTVKEEGTGRKEREQPQGASSIFPDKDWKKSKEKKAKRGYEQGRTK